MTIYEKLADIQLRLEVPKEHYNKHGQYNFRNAEDILKATKPMLAEVKLLLFLSDEVEFIGTKNYIKATATLIDLDTNEKLCVSAYAREDEVWKGMNSAQISGSTSSYARKYALSGLFKLDDGKDADDTPEQSPEEEYPTCAICGKVIQDQAAIDYVKKTGKAVRCMECANR